MALRIFIAIGLWVVSVGWVLPLALSASLAWSWLNTEVAPVVHGGKPGLNSFPLLSDSQRLFWIGFIWGALVLACWLVFFLRRWVRQKEIA